MCTVIEFPKKSIRENNIDSQIYSSCVETNAFMKDILDMKDSEVFNSISYLVKGEQIKVGEFIDREASRLEERIQTDQTIILRLKRISTMVQILSKLEIKGM